MTREEIRAGLIETVDRAMATTKPGENVHAVLAKLVLEKAVGEAMAMAVRVCHLKPGEELKP